MELAKSESLNNKEGSAAPVNALNLEIGRIYCEIGNSYGDSDLFDKQKDYLTKSLNIFEKNAG